MGDTGFGVDYNWAGNVVDEYGVQLYSQFRWYTVDRGDFDDIHLGTVGSLVRF